MYQKEAIHLLHQPLILEGEYIDPDTLQLPVLSGKPLQVIERSWSSTEVIDPDYLERVAKVISAYPKDNSSFNPPVSATPRTVEQGMETAKKKDAFLTGKGYDAFTPPAPALHPFPLIPPIHLKDFETYVYHEGKQNEVTKLYEKIRVIQQNNDPYARTPNSYRSDQLELQYIMLMNSWNQWYADFLECLSLDSPEERINLAESKLNSLFSGRTIGYIHTFKPIEQISRHDKKDVWMFYMAFNVLTSPERGISSVARFRAAEILDQAIDKVGEKKFFDDLSLSMQRLSISSLNVDHMQAFRMAISSSLLRLPRSMWRGEERNTLIHKKWAENPELLKLFGLSTNVLTEQIDFQGLTNKLVNERPHEAIQILVCLMSEHKTQKNAVLMLRSLTQKAQIDPIFREKAFGAQASYIYMHYAPSSLSEMYAESAGLPVKGLSLADQYRGQPENTLLAVISSLGQQVDNLKEHLGIQEERFAKAAFATMGEKQAQLVDPEGLLRTLGVHPETDFDDMKDLVESNRKRLARTHHPDTGGSLKRMQEINMAADRLLEILADEFLRRQYFKR
jgi:hypothetical protein